MTVSDFMNRTSEETHAEVSGREPQALNCPACGAAARRTGAHFCATCGRGLRERAYAPADSLFASYHQQRNRPATLFESSAVGVSVQGATRLRVFDNGGNTSAAIALVLVFSALVPFIGILFCPLAVFAGGLGLFEAWFVPRVGGARLAACCVGFGFLIAGAQVLLFRLI
jgi:ribosomal protein L37AE/L43A